MPATDFGQLRQPLSCGQGLFKRDDDDDDYTHLTFRNYKVHIRVYYLELRKEILSIDRKAKHTQRHTQHTHYAEEKKKKIGLVRDLNPGPLAP